MATIEIKTEDEYKKLIESDQTSVVLFSAKWVQQCNQILDIMAEISKLGYENLQFINLEAESFPDISLKHQVDAVPTVIFFKSGQVVDRVNGVNVELITEFCKRHGILHEDGNGTSLDDKLRALINKADIMLFMKGSRDAPRCGFSKQIISILNDISAQYETFDILTDEEVRQGLKVFSDWPTYPQLYVKGELIGGLDIIKELQSSGELLSTLGMS